MKRFLLLLLVCVLLVSLCSCDVGVLPNKTDSKSDSQIDVPVRLGEDELKANALSVAEKFLGAFFGLDFVEADRLSHFDFKEQLTQVSKVNPDMGIYFDGNVAHAGSEVFESKEHFLEVFSERVGPAISVNIDAGNVELFSAEEYEAVAEDNGIYESEFFAVESLEAAHIALARFNVTWEVMDTNSLQGPEEEIHEGVVAVLMAYADEEWIIFSPSITGILMGFDYFK